MLLKFQIGSSVTPISCMRFVVIYGYMVRSARVLGFLLAVEMAATLDAIRIAVSCVVATCTRQAAGLTDGGNVS